MIYQRPSVTLSEWAGLAEFTNRLLIDHHFEKYVMRKIVQNYQFACGHGFQTNLNSKDSLALVILMGHVSKQTKISKQCTNVTNIAYLAEIDNRRRNQDLMKFVRVQS